MCFRLMDSPQRVNISLQAKLTRLPCSPSTPPATSTKLLYYIGFSGLLARMSPGEQSNVKLSVLVSLIPKQTGKLVIKIKKTFLSHRCVCLSLHVPSKKSIFFYKVACVSEYLFCWSFQNCNVKNILHRKHVSKSLKKAYLTNNQLCKIIKYFLIIFTIS